MRCSLITLIFLSFLFVPAKLPADDDATAAAAKTARQEATPIERVAVWLKQFEHKRTGDLPATFSVRIAFDGRLVRETAAGTYVYRPREVYEFTPKEVRRLCIRATGLDKPRAPKYRRDAKGNIAYEVAARKPFTKIDKVCRILMALKYLELIYPDEHDEGENLDFMQVMTDSGLRPIGEASIRVSAAGAEVESNNCCVGVFFATSAQSIRFAALYHTLRRLARSELGLSGGDWDDALDIIDADGSIKPAAGVFRAK
ncbi:MAG: hypothetical protein QGG36_01710 [Pirellulaceae bacterium]|jgi:hypothetical protein|nr:hypothetical protein [Pirellulaceae bacterium]MDP7014494.1 hypothetical protein [Pirellulaceae bacterium]